MPVTKRNSASERGFTMIVIASLFVAFAVVAAVAIERNSTLQQIARRDAAKAQLTRLSNAILEYAVFNKVGNTLVYPCPARVDLGVSDTNFGISVNNGASPAVQNCLGTDHTGVTVLSGNNSNVLRGMVPVQTLSQYGLGINDAFDPWGNRIMYVVNRDLTNGAASTVQTDNPTVADRRTSTSLAAPDFILISYGKDGLGGHKRATASTTATIGCTNTNALRDENCDNDDVGFYFSPTYSSSDPATYFDDIISFYRQ